MTSLVGVLDGRPGDLLRNLSFDCRLMLFYSFSQVDNQSLQGYTNHQAVEILRNTSTVVKLCLARYLRGDKYEQLQQAIGELFLFEIS